MYLAKLVADFGYEVVVSVRSGSAAIAKAMAVSLDVALMDIRLADGSGARFFWNLSGADCDQPRWGPAFCACSVACQAGEVRARAAALRRRAATLQAVAAGSAGRHRDLYAPHLDDWCQQVMCSCTQPMKKIATTMRVAISSLWARGLLGFTLWPTWLAALGLPRRSPY